MAIDVLRDLSLGTRRTAKILLCTRGDGYFHVQTNKLVNLRNNFLRHNLTTRFLNNCSSRNRNRKGISRDIPLES